MDQGAWLAAVSATAATGTALLLRRRLPAYAVLTILVLAGAGIGWGGMLIQPDPSIGENVAAVAMLAVLVPAHVRIVLGPFGPQR
ncbi:MAG: hypothetical protein ACRDHM_11580 [Actinomycetota bacterium]